MTLWTVVLQAPLSMGFSRQEYCSRLLFPPPGDFPSPGIEPTSPESLALAGGFFTTSAIWEALIFYLIGTVKRFYAWIQSHIIICLPHKVSFSYHHSAMLPFSKYLSLTLYNSIYFNIILMDFLIYSYYSIGHQSIKDKFIILPTKIL